LSRGTRRNNEKRKVGDKRRSKGEGKEKLLKKLGQKKCLKTEIVPELGGEKIPQGEGGRKRGVKTKKGESNKKEKEENRKRKIFESAATAGKRHPEASGGGKKKKKNLKKNKT